ncbi:LacI family DNA-binding transcriptional regulator [Lentilactobacillus hilgardii]|uniref:Substrate-binding domain-containing protein n=1 Tax=Lentilactobacillus hilgardii TaxID=1588 RepID=A0A6P1E6N4_LENHI|nr:LacI family DNA-binding transcriptional regulator [Lentilactobacillus hilgardii]RRG10294.1 MAG: LacI family transcriptional regulator [Lactobacillus sp.]EEI71691.1 transcriptional regulator, LacI family [Lentilactobacillus hilgardii ATCC 27305]MCP9334441.1 LacI family DNA-binding transcriptional regulator [Lentilactobacillus hilgardii]MCP9351034.1 LacI family DNA-binding transcriptional regulator [Lentilactobacillus hilgardii]MCP9353874.1 LacI family DNA-binding transcriptional regulator [L
MGVTIKDIAKEANVSIASVSRILSGKSGFNSKKTIKKVKDIAKKMGYRKNTAAVELVTQSSKVLAVIVSATKTNFANQIINGIHEEAYKHGLNVIIIYAGENDPQRQFEAVRTVIERSVRGILLLALDLSDESYNLLKEAGTPYIFLSISNNRGFPFIASDDYLIGYQSTKYLIDKGHQNIALTGLETTSYVGKKRIKGYLDALNEDGIIPKPEWVIDGSFTYEDGVNTLKSLGKSSEITGIVACSDFVGLGLINQASAWGIKVPDELSIISVDGTEVCELVRPNLTSVTQSFYEMGTLGVRYLIESNQDDHYKKFTGLKIEERQSTKRNGKILG